MLRCITLCFSEAMPEGLYGTLQAVNSFLEISLAAFTGTLLAAIAIYLLAWNQGSSSVRLILVGSASPP